MKALRKESLMTIDELSEYLSIPKGSIYNMVHERRLPHIKLGRRVRFVKEEIDEWLERQRVETIEW